MRRLALSLLAVTLLALFGPLLLGARVVYPHDNTLEVGLFAAEPLGPPSNRRLTDVSHYYLPALEQQLNGNSSGWLSTWDPHVELGRPSIQLYGLGKAFLLTHVLSWFSDDALRVHTWSSVAAIVLACLFGFLLLEALGLHPLACLTGALGIGIGSLTMYSTCFPLFLWGVCWTTALFWSVTRFVGAPKLVDALALAFFTHSLLLTAYPQFIVWQAYLLAGYALLVLRRSGLGRRAALARGTQLAGCVLVGALSATPVYWDLFQNAQRSTRLAFDPEFFARNLPRLDSLAEQGTFIAGLFDALSFGSPAAPDFPAQQVEPLLLPLWACLAAAGLALAGLRRTWPILACVMLALLLTIWKDAYLFAARTLGFGLSRSVPIRLAHLPLIVLAAMAADRLLCRAPGARGKSAVLVLLASGLAGLGLWLAELPVARANLAFAAVIVAGTLGFVLTRRGWLLASLVLASALVCGQRLQSARAPDELRLDSPLLERLRQETAGGARFAWAGPNPSNAFASLAPNQEALYGLRSIHSYNPLFSRAYQAWAARYRQTQERGSHDRRFLSVVRVPDFLRESAALTATTVLLSRTDQTPGGAVALGSFGPIGVFRTNAAPLFQYQTEHFERTPDGGARFALPAARDTLPAARDTLPARTTDEDERLAFRLEPAAGESLLFVSQQYHPGWRARAGERALETLEVNGVFQGVLVPPGTPALELTFECAARWSWIPQALFVLGALLLAARRLAARA